MNNYLDIDRIVFIGRTYDEYIRLFDLDESILKKGPILDCPAGASSFTAEAYKSGFKVTACDILYDLDVEELMDKGKEDIAHVFQKVDGVSHLYSWKYYKNRNEVVAFRKKALKMFVDDFPEGYGAHRYVQAELPHLPFPDRTFSLVLSSHFLFLYGDRLNLDFHNVCLKELVRVSYGEVRIFPLEGLDAKPYHYMDKVLSFLHSADIKPEIVKAPFEFQRGANQMMKLSRYTEQSSVASSNKDSSS